MADPAVQVFAITKLLEQILLYVYEAERFQDSESASWAHDMGIELDESVETIRKGRMQAMKRLFVLQMVSKSFTSAIAGLPELRRYMWLQPDADRHPFRHRTVTQIMAFLETVVPEIKVLKMSSCAEYSTVSFELRDNRDAICQRLVHQKQQSWRDIQLPGLRKPLHIRVRVRFGQSSLKTAMRYTEATQLRSNEIALGQMANVFDRVLCRSTLEHWLLAIDEQGLVAGVFVRLMILCTALIFAVLLLCLANGCQLALMWLRYEVAISALLLCRSRKVPIFNYTASLRETRGQILGLLGKVPKSKNMVKSASTLPKTKEKSIGSGRPTTRPDPSARPSVPHGLVPQAFHDKHRAWPTSDVPVAVC